jgi:peptidoglycan/xylan/chitin deacetylase (PgdA/CDA1 family)
MRYSIFVFFFVLSQVLNAQNCDSLSFEIKEHQLASFPEFYSKTINDCYNRRNATGILRELCSTSQIGDTIFVLELLDRVEYVFNYASLWNSKKPNEIFSYDIYRNGNNEEIYYSKGTEFPPKMLIACHRWDINYLKKMGLEHIKHWTSRTEVLLTRVIIGQTNAIIDCAVFYDFH